MFRDLRCRCTDGHNHVAAAYVAWSFLELCSRLLLIHNATHVAQPILDKVANWVLVVIQMKMGGPLISDAYGAWWALRLWRLAKAERRLAVVAVAARRSAGAAGASSPFMS